MILICILIISGVLLIGFVMAAVCIGGALFLIIFGDVVVCIFIIAWLIHYLAKKKNKDGDET